MVRHSGCIHSGCKALVSTQFEWCWELSGVSFACLHMVYKRLAEPPVPHLLDECRIGDDGRHAVKQPLLLPLQLAQHFAGRRRAEAHGQRTSRCHAGDGCCWRCWDKLQSAARSTIRSVCTLQILQTFRCGEPSLRFCCAYRSAANAGELHHVAQITCCNRTHASVRESGGRRGDLPEFEVSICTQLLQLRHCTDPIAGHVRGCQMTAHRSHSNRCHTGIQHPRR